MLGSVHRRFFSSLADLIPLHQVSGAGGSFYAPPRLPSDMALLCLVSPRSGGLLDVEISHDFLAGKDARAALWLSIRVDLSAQTAELIAVEDPWRYEVVYSDRDLPNPRSAHMHIHAINNLTSMLHLGGEFRHMDLPAVSTGHDENQEAAAA